MSSPKYVEPNQFEEINLLSNGMENCSGSSSNKIIMNNAQRENTSYKIKRRREDTQDDETSEDWKTSDQHEYTRSAGDDCQTTPRAPKRQKLDPPPPHSSPKSSNSDLSIITSNTSHDEQHRVPSAGEAICQTPPRPQEQQNVNNSFKPINSGQSTITSKPSGQEYSRSAGEGSIKPRKLFSSTLEDLPAWAKLMMKAVHFDAHFQVLETRFEEMKIQISDLLSTMKEFRSALNDQQGIPSTDHHVEQESKLQLESVTLSKM